jgi:hypothetical protein
MPKSHSNAAATFAEGSAIEKGFQRVFDAEIAPKLAILTGDGSSLRGRTLRDLKLLAIVAAIAVVALTIMVDAGMSMVAFVLIAIFAGDLIYRRQTRWEQQVIDAVLPSICAFLDLRYSPTRAADDYVAPFEKLGVVGKSNRRTLTHHFTGSRSDTGFEFAHADLTRRSGGKNRTNSPIFHGLLFRIQVPVQVPIRILIVPNFGTITLKLAKMFPSAADVGMTAISFGNPSFEEKLKVTAELRGPQDEAWVRHFLDPGFQSALLAIDEAEGRLSYGCSAISAAFMGDTFYLSLSRWEKRKLGPIVYEQPRGFMQQRLLLRKRLDLEKAIHEIFNDVATAYRIIDQLHQNAADETIAVER